MDRKIHRIKEKKKTYFFLYHLKTQKFITNSLCEEIFSCFPRTNIIHSLPLPDVRLNARAFQGSGGRGEQQPVRAAHNPHQERSRCHQAGLQEGRHSPEVPLRKQVLLHRKVSCPKWSKTFLLLWKNDLPRIIYIFNEKLPLRKQVLLHRKVSRCPNFCIKNY